MIHANKRMNPHFGTDQADIQIRGNSEIQTRIPDHIWPRQCLRFVTALVGYCNSLKLI